MTSDLLRVDPSPNEIRRRRLRGLDRFDEVWNGVYVVSPSADNEHQRIGTRLAFAIESALPGEMNAEVFSGGVNVSDHLDDWSKNYRVPDVSVFLPGNPAIDKGSHWFGGPDVAIEILSPNDRARKKFGFYAAVGVRELILLNRKPWRFELHGRQGEGWAVPRMTTVETSEPIRSDVLGLTFRLIPGDDRPLIELTRDDGQRWLA